MITAFAGRVKRTPCLRDGPGHHPSRVILPSLTRSVPTIFNTCKNSDGGRSHDFRRFPNCPHSPRSCPPTASH